MNTSSTINPHQSNTTESKTMTETTTYATSINSKYNYRYFGGTNPDQEKAGYASLAKAGVITVASILSDDKKSIHGAISFTPPGVKFDKAFSRAIAKYRLDSYVLEAPCDMAQSVEDLRIALESVKNRVHKTVTKNRLSHDLYLSLRANKPGSADKPANVGYHEYTAENYSVEDFIDVPGDYTFTVDMEGVTTHSGIDMVILQELGDGNFHEWALDLVACICDEIETRVEEQTDRDNAQRSSDEHCDEEQDIEDSECDESDEESEDDPDQDISAEELNASFDSLGLCQCNDGFALFPNKGDEDDMMLKYYLTPVFPSKEALADWLLDLSNKVRNEMPCVDHTIDCTN